MTGVGTAVAVVAGVPVLMAAGVSGVSPLRGAGLLRFASNHRPCGPASRPCRAAIPDANTARPAWPPADLVAAALSRVRGTAGLIALPLRVSAARSTN